MTAPPPGTGKVLAIEHTDNGGCSVVCPRGTLNAATYPLLRDGLLKHAAESPDAVLVDLEFLQVEREHLLSVFSLVWMRVAEWPGVPVMLIVGDEQRRRGLQRSAVARYVPVHADAAQARAVLPEEPTRRRMHRTLPADVSASGHARSLVRDACAQWGIDGLAGDAQQVATELVENALKHAGSEPSLRLDLRRGMLTIAVSDDSPARPAVREASPTRDSGRGMHLVAAFARKWGATPTLAGGKVVWAVLSVAEDHRVRPFLQ